MPFPTFFILKLIFCIKANFVLTDMASRGLQNNSRLGRYDLHLNFIGKECPFFPCRFKVNPPGTFLFATYLVVIFVKENMLRDPKNSARYETPIWAE